MFWIAFGGLGSVLWLLASLLARRGGRRPVRDDGDDLEPLVDVAMVMRARLRELAVGEVCPPPVDCRDAVEARSEQPLPEEPPAAGTPARSAEAEQGPVPPPSRRGPMVRVLGCPAVFDAAGNRVSGFREAAVELLVYLAVHRSGASIEGIKKDVYGNADSRRAAERLSTDLANLRQRLRGAFGADASTNPVVKSGDRYRLAPDVVTVDWWQVQDACRQAQAAAPGTAEQEAAVAIAAGLFDAPLADGASYDWLAAPQEHSRRLGIAVHTRLAELVASKDAPRSARQLERATAFDPFDEPLAARAIKAHLHVDNQDAAARRFEELREALEELGEVPAPATSALVGRSSDRRAMATPTGRADAVTGVAAHRPRRAPSGSR